jgi:hypothetical protein
MIEIINDSNGTPIGAIVQGHHGLYFFRSYTKPPLDRRWQGPYQELRHRIENSLAN